jgi:hypothetical protein
MSGFLACVVCYCKTPDFICWECMNFTFSTLKMALKEQLGKTPEFEDIKELCNQGNISYCKKTRKDTGRITIWVGSKANLKLFINDNTVYTIPNNFDNKYWTLFEERLKISWKEFSEEDISKA